jgi:hypothetical protein
MRCCPHDQRKASRDRCARSNIYELTGQLDVDSPFEREIARVAADRTREAIDDILG